jgi:hypothetical protein
MNHQGINHQIEPSVIPPVTNVTSPKGDAYPAEFETFWSAYGRKGTKSTAANEWKRHAKGIPLAVILDAIPVYFATERVAVRGFKLDAERFLSRHVWENPTMGEENDAPPRASPAEGGNGQYLNSAEKTTNALRRYAERITPNGTAQADESGAIVRTYPAGRGISHGHG